MLLSSFNYFQISQNMQSEDPNSDDDFISTKSFPINDVPKSGDSYTNLQTHCVAFSVLMYFKMTQRMIRRKQVSFWFAFAVYPCNFLSILSVYVYQVLWHFFLGKNFSLKFFFSNEKQKNISTFVFYRFSQINIFQLYYAHVTSVRFEHSVCCEPLLASFLHIPKV